MVWLTASPCAIAFRTQPTHHARNRLPCHNEPKTEPLAEQQFKLP